MPRFQVAKAGSLRAGSPPGRSTLITSAPWSLSSIPNMGPGMYWPKSKTCTPRSAPCAWVRSLVVMAIALKFFFVIGVEIVAMAQPTVNHGLPLVYFTVRRSILTARPVLADWITAELISVDLRPSMPVAAGSRSSLIADPKSVSSAMKLAR